MKNILRKWLGIETLEHRQEGIEQLILHEETKYNGFLALDPNKLEQSKKLIFRGKKIFTE